MNSGDAELLVCKVFGKFLARDLEEHHDPKMAAYKQKLFLIAKAKNEEEGIADDYRDVDEVLADTLHDLKFTEDSQDDDPEVGDNEVNSEGTILGSSSVVAETDVESIVEDSQPDDEPAQDDLTLKGQTADDLFALRLERVFNYVINKAINKST